MPLCRAIAAQLVPLLLFVLVAILLPTLASSSTASTFLQSTPHLPRSSIDVDALAQELTQGKRQSSDGVPLNVTPVVIVASLLGSKLEAQLHGYSSEHAYCWTEWKEWFTTWVGIRDLIPPLENCWYEWMVLHFDPLSGRSFNTPGVEIRPVDYGGVNGVTYLDDYGLVPMWSDVVNLLQALGWEVGKSLRGAPYDWRFGPATFASRDWPRLRTLIEETYALNNNTRVSLSMGGPYFLGFLNQQSQAWKDKYLHSYISFDGAFGGSASATAALISTTNWWSSQFPYPEMIKKLAQSWPSIMWMLPISQVYDEQQVLVSTTNPPKNYTVANLAQLLIDAQGHNASIIYRTLKEQKWFTFGAPEVESHCFFGTGVATPISMTFATDSFSSVPEVAYGNGDGVVPEAGLRMLGQWRGKQDQPINLYPIQGLSHSGSVHDKQVLRMFLDILGSHN